MNKYYELNHLENNDLTYFQHMFRAWKLALLFYMGFILTLIHSFFPIILPTASTDTNRIIKNILDDHSYKIFKKKERLELENRIYNTI